MDVQVNMLAVLLAVLSSLVVGSAWYARGTFGTVWMKLARIDPKAAEKNSMLAPMAITIVVSFLTAYVLAHVTYLSNQFFHHSFLRDALSTAFWLWLGLTAARFATHDAFEGRPRMLTLITLGNEFFTIMIMGLIIGLLGV